LDRVALRVRRLFRRVIRAWRAEQLAFSRRRPLKSGTVFYESFGGNGALCNPEAIFRELLRRTDVAVTTHIWALDRPRGHRAFIREFARDRRVHIVRRGSSRYYRALATSEYLINNATFPAEFGKRTGQIYLNTWHGTPLKRMGYDMPDGASQAANTRRNFLAADYLLSQSQYMTTTMYEGAYRLRGAFRGVIIEAGYPRVDHQLESNDPPAARAALERAGIVLGEKRLVLFAPTWKGESFARPEDDVDEVMRAARDLQAHLGSGHLVLVKTHQSVYAYAQHVPEWRGLIVPNDIPTNSLLRVVDSLVTDYSSIFFDYLVSDRPIVFYVPAGDDYDAERGTYLPSDDLPGPVCGTIDEVTARLSASPVETERWHDRRREWAARYTPHSDGSAAARIVEIVFRGAREGYRLVSIGADERTSLLIHLGGMRSNGITTSALNLIEHIDHGRYQVSVVFTRPSSRQQWKNQSRIDPRVIQFHRSGGMNGSKVSHLLRKLAERKADSELHSRSLIQSDLWQAEWVRCFGDSAFDAVIDFSGYSPFWATLLLHSPSARRSIWMHNDMEAETRRVIRGRMRMFRSLHAVFALYSQYDAMISVSSALRDINRHSLAARYGLPGTEFLAAVNVVNERRVIKGSRVPLLDVTDYPIDELTLEPIVPDWARMLSTPRETIWFCSVGRFSTEKNQARMIRAFAQVHGDDPRTRLLLIGYGPLRAELDALVRQLRLVNAVFIDGPFHNPFRFIAASDCFVLSSSYEGQPMVLLEAALVGIPIVTVRFASVSGALPDGSMRIVEQSDDALAAGMRAFLLGEIPRAQLDAQLYNAAALTQFELATTAGSIPNLNG
jgi:CDP-glycerol glycerophosphotransferase